MDRQGRLVACRPDMAVMGGLNKALDQPKTEPQAQKNILMCLSRCDTVSSTLPTFVAPAGTNLMRWPGHDAGISLGHLRQLAHQMRAVGLWPAGRC